MPAGEQHYVAVYGKEGSPTAEEHRLCDEVARFLGIQLDALKIVQCYHLPPELIPDELKRVADLAFADPIVETASVASEGSIDGDWVIEIAAKPGVNDNLAATAQTACEDCLGKSLAEFAPVRTSRRYHLSGSLSNEEVQKIAHGWLGNPLIHDIHWWEPSDRSQHVETVALPDDDAQLMEISRTRLLALNLEEMHAIRSHYRRPDVRIDRAKRELPHDPTDAELEALAQTWSEHCKHKIFNAKIHYKEAGVSEEVNSIFKSYIQRATNEMASEQDWVVSVFSDNAGIVKLDDEWNLSFKVETHNSPSALDPYGGALTGILGVNRDSMGTGIGARLVANTDVFCFAPPTYKGDLPPRLQHPVRVLRGVRRGVEDGGNKSGIPTVNGSLVFHDDYLGKPLVYCGTVGIMPAQVNGTPSEQKTILPGDLIVLVGGRTGRDGIHGATFSSEALHEDSPSSAVQIGAPFTQKKVHDFLLEARDRGLYRTLTDNGAGGLSSSVGEMAELCGGAKLQLDKVPLKADDLAPWEILLSESQERMTLAAPPEHWHALQILAEEFAVEVSSVGSFTDQGYFEVFFGETPVVYLPLGFLHDGVPQLELEAEWQPPTFEAYEERESDILRSLEGLLHRPNICSKEGIVRQYDHEVQASTVIKPMCGPSGDGPSDSAVIQPLEVQEKDSYVGFVLGHGICPRYSAFDAYNMAACAVDEALRNCVAVGGNPDQTAILDNFCWPDPVFDPVSNPDGKLKLAQLVRACRGLYDTATVLRTPLISGKDSMKNDYHMDGVKISVPPTLLVSALSQTPDVRKAVTMDAKSPGDRVYVVGVTRNELGGSEYLLSLGLNSEGAVPTVDPLTAQKSFRALYQAIQCGCVASCHDASDGGLLVALAESAFSGELGMELDFRKVPTEGQCRDEAIAFSETPSRFVVTVSPKHCDHFESLLSSVLYSDIGVVTEKESLGVVGLNGQKLFEAPIDRLKAAWKHTPELGACDER